jgi:hypothetical protein
MIRFCGRLVILDSATHARMLADVVVARSELVDWQCRALEAERLLRREQMAAACLEHVNEEMRAQIRLDEALMGFGVEG